VVDASVEAVASAGNVDLIFSAMPGELAGPVEKSLLPLSSFQQGKRSPNG